LLIAGPAFDASRFNEGERDRLLGAASFPEVTLLLKILSAIDFASGIALFYKLQGVARRVRSIWAVN
jgi:hypothetical protein